MRTLTYFADSSALVKRHIEKIGSEWFTEISTHETGNSVIISRLSIVEVFSAFNRRCRELSLSEGDYVKVAQDFLYICRTDYRVIEITEKISEKSRELLERYPLRASDAIQLASALLTNEKFIQKEVSELIFLTSDQKLLHAATDENLRNDDPQNHP